MNQSGNRITRLAVLSLMLIGIASLLILSGLPHSAQAINPFQPTLLGGLNPAIFPFSSATPNTRAFVTMQQGCQCADVVLVIDDTDSMDPAINNDLKPGLSAIISAAVLQTGNDLRMGVVTFKDDIQVDQPLIATSNTAGPVGVAVNALMGAGGNGEPEASDEALRLVVSGLVSSGCMVSPPPALGQFRENCVKLVILVTDAPPGGCNDQFTPGVDDVNANNVAQIAKNNKFIISAVLVNNGTTTGGAEDTVMMNYATVT